MTLVDYRIPLLRPLDRNPLSSLREVLMHCYISTELTILTAAWD